MFRVFWVYFGSETAQVELECGRVEAPASRSLTAVMESLSSSKAWPTRRGLHSSASQLNLSRF